MSKKVIGIICMLTTRHTITGYYKSGLVHIMFGVLLSHHLFSLLMSDCHMCLVNRVYYQGLYAARYMSKSPNTYKECSASWIFALYASVPNHVLGQ